MRRLSSGSRPQRVRSEESVGSALQGNMAKSPGSLSHGQAEYGGVTVLSASPRGGYDADGGCRIWP